MSSLTSPSSSNVNSDAYNQQQQQQQSNSATMNQQQQHANSFSMMQHQQQQQQHPNHSQHSNQHHHHHQHHQLANKHNQHHHASGARILNSSSVLLSQSMPIQQQQQQHQQQQLVQVNPLAQPPHYSHFFNNQAQQQQQQQSSAFPNVSMNASQSSLLSSSPPTYMSVMTSAGGSSASNQPNPIQELLNLFECPVCFDFAMPPIMQCHSGHIVCSNCRPKLTCCPTCRNPLGNIRNLSMEKLANSLKFPCKYTINGCVESMSYEKKYDHEDHCEFRPYNCPCPGQSCKWQGSLDQVMPHLVLQHKSITTLQGEDIVFLATDITLPGSVDWVMMQSCFGYNFMLVLEKQEKNDNYQQFFAIVQLIGTPKQAEQFAYKLELNGKRRRLTWEATTRSIHDGVQQAISNCDCLVFDTATAQLFADAGNLGINVTISLN